MLTTNKNPAPEEPEENLHSELARPSRRAAQRARSRRRILDAAAAALTDTDAARVTVRDIAARADVSPGLVMQHFGSMADLILEVFIEANADLDAHLEAAAAAGSTARERVLLAFRRLAERDLSRPQLSGRMMAAAWTWTGAQEDRFRDSVHAVTERLMRTLEDAAHPVDEDALQAAAVALVAIYNVSLRRAVTAGLDADAMIARMAPSVDIVLDGLAAQPRPHEPRTD